VVVSVDEKDSDLGRAMVVGELENTAAVSVTSFLINFR